MTIEEIRKAKREAEERIQQELDELQMKTGMSLADVRVRFVELTSLESCARKVASEVLIDLRVP